MSLTNSEQADLYAAQQILNGGVDRRKFFHFRNMHRSGWCRACGETIMCNQPVVHCNGNREAVILCMPCVWAFSHALNSHAELTP
jgi:hypothetical protein